LIVVDMQYDFIDGALGTSEAEAIDNILYIYSESGSGCTYAVDSKEDIKKYVEEYFENYID